MAPPGVGGVVVRYPAWSSVSLSALTYRTVGTDRSVPAYVSSAERYAHIDALRAIAVLLVLGVHVIDIGWPREHHPWAKALLTTVDPGRIGVVLFFAISGFVIPSSFEGSGWAGARRFLIRRFFRLYPIYWLSVMTTAIVFVGIFKGETISWPQLLANATMIHQVLGFESVNPVYWTLSIELLFYAICLSLFLCGRIQQSRTLVVIILALGACLWAWAWLAGFSYHIYTDVPERANALYWLVARLFGVPVQAWGNPYFLTLVYLSIMTLGALLRLWYEDRIVHRIDRIFLWSVVAYWLYLPVPAVIKAVWLKTGWSQAYLYLTYAIPVALFVLLVCLLQIRSRALCYIGVISYSIYVLHTTILYGVVTVVRAFDVQLGLILQLSAVLIVLITLGLAALTYETIEKPAMRLGRRLSRQPQGA